MSKEFSELIITTLLSAYRNKTHYTFLENKQLISTEENSISANNPPQTDNTNYEPT